MRCIGDLKNQCTNIFLFCENIDIECLLFSVYDNAFVNFPSVLRVALVNYLSVLFVALINTFVNYPSVFCFALVNYPSVVFVALVNPFVEFCLLY